MNVKSYELFKRDVTDISQYAHIQEKALAGDPESQFCLGLMYQCGHGTKHSTKDAHKWFSKAAEQGILDAQFYLALLHISKDSGVDYDMSKAIKLLKKASRNGHSRSKARLETIAGSAKLLAG